MAELSVIVSLCWRWEGDREGKAVKYPVRQVCEVMRRKARGPRGAVLYECVHVCACVCVCV